MRTQDKVNVLVERREPSRRIVREWVKGTIVSEARDSPYGYVYHWCVIEPGVYDE